MFDIGFTEITLIAVVALIVLGPEKLPKTARTLGHLFGRLQRYVGEVKADINRELQLEELRKLQGQVQTAAKDIETSMASASQEMQAGVQAVESELSDAGAAKLEPASAAAPQLPDAGPGEPSAGGAPRQDTLPGLERP